MGCDIHLYVEKRVAGKWVSADKWIKSEDDPKRMRLSYKDAFYHDRNYDLFAILANVRNGHGFAGCKTGDGFNPIAEPRGLPEDVCELVRAESDAWDCDGHSHSYFTVAELMRYDWTQTVTKSGVVDAATFEKWRRMKEWVTEPENYSGGVGGPSVKHVTPVEMDKLVTKAMEDAPQGQGNEGIVKHLHAKLHDIYTRVEWDQPYSERVSYFLSGVLPKLWRLGLPDNVRIVFWFDN